MVVSINKFRNCVILFLQVESLLLVMLVEFIQSLGIHNYFLEEVLYCIVSSFNTLLTNRNSYNRCKIK